MSFPDGEQAERELHWQPELHDFPTTLIPQSPGGFLANTTPLVVFSSVSSIVF